MNKMQEKLEAHFNPKRVATRLAQEKGVSLVGDAASGVTMPRGEVPDGWFAQNMPNVAQLLADLKAWLDPKGLWSGAAQNLARGQGYAVDKAAGLAVGSPPPSRWQRGSKSAEREGLTVTRVRPVEVRPAGSE